MAKLPVRVPMTMNVLSKEFQCAHADPNTPRWTWPNTDDLSSVLHPIAAAAAELLTSDQLSRIKRCARCPWLFLDNSKNHSRRWCDMNDCGRAQKIERYLARRAAAQRRTHPPCRDANAEPTPFIP